MRRPQRHPRASDGIAALFSPQSIAVIGSLREARFGGYVAAKHLLDFGFKGNFEDQNYGG